MTPFLLTALCLIPIGLLLAVGLCRAAADLRDVPDGNGEWL